MQQLKRIVSLIFKARKKPVYFSQNDFQSCKKRFKLQWGKILREGNIPISVTKYFSNMQKLQNGKKNLSRKFKQFDIKCSFRSDFNPL